MVDHREPLITTRLRLRPIQAGDEHILWPAIADPEICRYMAWEAHETPGQTSAFVQSELVRQQEGRGITWMIFHANGEFCGIVSVIGVLRQHRALLYDRGELAYWLVPASRHQGIMHEAIAAVLRFGFSALNLHKLVVSHFSTNLASEQLIRRSGFRYIGEQVDEFKKNGVWHSHKCYELLDREYFAAEAAGATTRMTKDE
jgi:[ribosomal protein S5]-alanine N-acetyltransferase